MWTFVRTESAGFDWGVGWALVTLSKDGVDESFHLSFQSQPTIEQANEAGARYALQRSLAEAPPAPDDSMSQQDFFNRFTNTEIAAIYAAASSDGDVLAYVKRAEMTPRINRGNPFVVGGLNMFVTKNLLAAGRPAEILA